MDFVLLQLNYYKQCFENDWSRIYRDYIEPKALVDNDQLQYSGKFSWVLIFAFQCQETIYLCPNSFACEIPVCGPVLMFAL